MKTAAQSIKESLSLSEYGIPYDRLWERTYHLKGAMTKAEFDKTLESMQSKGLIDFQNNRYFLVG